MKVLGGMMALGLLASGGAAAAQSGSASDPAENWQVVLACAAQSSAATRHACVDQVLRNAGALNPQQEARQQREDFGRTERSARAANPAPTPPPPPPVSVARAPAPTPTAPQPPAPEPERIDGITSTIAAARIGADGKLLVATTDATVWRQVDGETFRIAPSSGTAFAVERGALGSLRCKVGSSGSYRCIRVD